MANEYVQIHTHTHTPLAVVVKLRVQRPFYTRATCLLRPTAWTRDRQPVRPFPNPSDCYVVQTHTHSDGKTRLHSILIQKLLKRVDQSALK